MSVVGVRERRRAIVEGLGAAPPVLEVRDVLVRFGGLVANDVTSLTVREGRIVGVIGANGAGKTTLFDVVSGFVSPHRGSIVLDGTVDLVGLTPTARARLGIGRSFQSAALFESLTVADALAVAFERRLEGQGFVSGALAMPWTRRAERRVRAGVADLVDLMGLGAFHDKFISELSTGSRRIVDLACIMAHRPRLLLLDEPSSGIAQREVEALEAMLRRVQRELDCTMLVVEHDIPLIRSLSDELYAMETGRVIAHGTPDEVLADPDVIRSYLGTDATAVERSGVTRAADAVADGSGNGQGEYHGSSVAPEPAHLESLTVAGLREMAGRLDIVGRSRMKRDELLAAVRLASEEES